MTWPRVALSRIACLGCAALSVIVVLLASCSTADAPRRSEYTTAETPPTFASPRVEYAVKESPDIGAISLRGVVRGRSQAQQFAPADGRVLEVFFARGESVAVGDPVLTFLPAPSPAEEIALEIAQLQVELAEEQGDAAALTANQQAYEDLLASYNDRTVTVSAQSAGLIGRTRQNAIYLVDEGDELFALGDPSDTIVEVELDDRDLEALTPGSLVAMVLASDDSGPVISGRVTFDRDEASDDGELVTARVELDDPTQVELGDRLLVRVQVDSGAGRWIPQDFVHRSDGRSFLLVADDGDQLRRVDVRLGQRTNTHVQVLSPIDSGTRLVAPA